MLRKAKRLGDDDPDDLVWQKLTRTTLDGIAVTPLGTAALLDGLETAGRPTRQGDWDIRAYVDGRDAKLANEESLVDLDGGVTSLWLRVDADTDLATLLDRVLLDLAPVVLDGADPAAFLAYLQGRELHPETNLGVPAADATAEIAQGGQQGRDPRLRRRRDPGPRPRCVRRPGARLVDGRRRGLPPHPHGRRAERRRGREPGGVPLRRHRRAVRRPSPSSVPPAGCGRGCSR